MKLPLRTLLRTALLSSLVCVPAKAMAQHGRAAGLGRPTSWRGEAVPFEVIDGTIFIEAEIAGRRGWMLIDTGASSSVVDSSFAGAMNLRAVSATGQIYASGGHLVSGRQLEDVPLVIPHLVSRRMPMVAADLAPLSHIAGRRVIAVIGYDLLSAMPLLINKGARTLALVPSGIDLGPGAASIPLLRTENRVQIASTIDGAPVRLTLDTGYSAGLSLTSRAWDRVKRPNAPMFQRRSVGASGAVDNMAASLVPEISFGRTAARDLEVRISAWDASYGDGVLGMELLARSSFLLDIPARRLWLIPPPVAPAAPR